MQVIILVVVNVLMKSNNSKNLIKNGEVMKCVHEKVDLHSSLPNNTCLWSSDIKMYMWCLGIEDDAANCFP